MNELESVINDLKIMANPTDKEMENLPEISGYEAQIILNEIERLNNIINELEKWLEEQLMYFNENNENGGFSTNVEDLEIVIDKLQELKGSDK